MKTSGVYGWHNWVSGKWYVGSSVHIERRKATHVKELNRATHTGVKLLRAWKKYGIDDWEFVVLEQCGVERKVLLEREQYWLDKLDAYKNGYNTLAKAGRPEGRVITPEQIAKTKATRLAHGGYSHTEATKKLIGDLQRGKPKAPMSEATKKKISKARKERGMSDTERQRISKMAKERVYTKEIRRNISEAHKGYVMPDIQKQKIASAHRGKPKSLDAMAKTFMAQQAKGTLFSLKTCIKYGLQFVQPTCLVCYTPFTPKSSGAKTCGRGCLIEISRQAAIKRWTPQ